MTQPIFDTQDGLDATVVHVGYMPDPPAFAGPMTPYLTDENSVGVWKPPVNPPAGFQSPEEELPS
jgi:hypothetical protein